MEEEEETAQLRQPKVQGELHQTLRKICFCCSQSSHSFKQHMCISGFFVLFLCMCVLACFCCTQWSVHEQSTSCLVHFAFVQKLHGKDVFMCGTFWQMYIITTSWGDLWFFSHVKKKIWIFQQQKIQKSKNIATVLDFYLFLFRYIFFN